MMIMKDFTCPICGDFFRKCNPAISRVDNETRICSDCGTQEALDAHDFGYVHNYWMTEEAK